MSMNASRLIAVQERCWTVTEQIQASTSTATAAVPTLSDQ